MKNLFTEAFASMKGILKTKPTKKAMFMIILAYVIIFMGWIYIPVITLILHLVFVKFIIIKHQKTLYPILKHWFD